MLGLRGSESDPPDRRLVAKVRVQDGFTVLDRHKNLKLENLRSGSFPIEAIEIHDFVPGDHEVMHELWL